MRLIDADELMTEIMDSDLDHLQRDDWKEVIQIVQDAPTIQPQRKKGNWVCIDGIDYECDQCGCVLEDWIQGAFYNYCPNCGSQMDGGEQDE